MGKNGEDPASELSFISEVSGYVSVVPHTQALQSETQVRADLPWSHGESEMDHIQTSKTHSWAPPLLLQPFLSVNVLLIKPGLCGAQAQLLLAVFPTHLMEALREPLGEKL